MIPWLIWIIDSLRKQFIIIEGICVMKAKQSQYKHKLDTPSFAAYEMCKFGQVI